MKAIGGFFELELPPAQEDADTGYFFNTGRNALECYLQENPLQKLHIPYYFCDVLLEPLHNLNIPYAFYFLDQHFFPKLGPEQVQEDEAVLYINYFGICNATERVLTDRFPRLILDRTLAFFEPLPEKPAPSFFSLRKFFGIPDGGLLKGARSERYEALPEDRSHERFDHLLKRFEEASDKAFPQFKTHEEQLNGMPVRKISPLSRSFYRCFDKEEVAEQRKANFLQLHNELGESNELGGFIDKSEPRAPMVYPYLCEDGEGLRAYLIQNRVFCATYWAGIEKYLPAGEGEWERRLQRDLVGLPIDQRYGASEMERVLRTVRAYEGGT